MKTPSLPNSFDNVQLEAIMSRAPNVLVSSGAGSGKTRVLTERYFRLLVDDQLKVEQILTLTFTRKASQEMRERIARRLDAEGRVYERRELMRAPLGTIHSFCERILREHALQAGIDPNFRLLDDAEAQTLQENVLDAVCENAWSGPEQTRVQLGRLFLDYPQRDLRKSLLETFRALRARGGAINDLHPIKSDDRALAQQRLDTAVEALLQLPGTQGWQEKLQEVEIAYRQLRPLLVVEGPFSWELFDQVQLLVGYLTPSGGPKGQAKEARDAIKEAAESWLAAYLDLAAQPYLQAFVMLLRHFDVAYRQALDEQGLLDFADLLLITRELLTKDEYGKSVVERFHRQFRQIMVDEFQDTNPLQFEIIHALQGDGHLFMVGDAKQAIYRFIGSDIGVFLAQERHILELGAQGERISMHANYRSRRELLEPLNGLFSRLWPLDAGTGGVLFEPLESERQFLAKSDPSVEIAFRPADDGSTAELRDREAQWITRRILQLTGTVGDMPLQLTRLGEETGELTARDAGFRDVIILFRASTDIPRYEDALRSAGVPFYVVSGRGFYQTQEIQDLVHLLRVLDNPLDDFAMTVVLRSPLVGVSDDTLYWLSRNWASWDDGQPYPAETEQSTPGRFWANINRSPAIPAIAGTDADALPRFRQLIEDLQAEIPAGQPLDLLDKALARTGYALTLLASADGEQRFANVQKLREVAATFQARNIFDLSDFQRYLTQLESLAPREASAPLDVEGSNVVRLMTIHAAKGLESPIVFVADCGRSPGGTPNAFFAMGDSVACKVPTPEDDWQQPAGYRRVVDTLAEDEERESERLLYVALTRAQEHLICSGSLGKGSRRGRPFSSMLAEGYGLSGLPEADTDLAVSYDGKSFPVRVWSSASLQAVEALNPPQQAQTLWQQQGPAMLNGAALPIVNDAGAVAHFARILDRLQPLPPARRSGIVRVGVNRAICYDRCPREYWLRHILHRDELPSQHALPPMLEVDPEREDADEARARADGTEFGKLLHAVLQRVDFTQPLIVQLDPILDELTRSTNQPPVPADDRDQLTACLRRLMEMEIYPALQRATTLYREVRFLAIEDEVYVPGIIDLLARDGDDWWILDYKTGHRSVNHLLQVGIYALGVQHSLGVTPTRVALAYLDETGPRTLRVEPVTPALLDEARLLIRRVGEGLRSDMAQAYTPKPGPHCKNCPLECGE